MNTTRRKKILAACNKLSVELPVNSAAVLRAFDDPIRKTMKMRTKQFILFKLSIGSAI